MSETVVQLVDDAAPKGASAIAPDTRGMNFFDADTALRDLLIIYAPDHALAHVTPHLSRLGHMVANELEDAAFLADRHPPMLHNRDRFGRDRQWIEYHPAYRQLEQAAYGDFELHAMSHRPALGWHQPLPTVIKHAFTYLFNQAEFGLGCPINVTDSGAHILIRFASEELKEKFLPNVLTNDVAVLTQFGQYMTEKEGGSDVGSLTSEARWDGQNWRIHGEKWFCSNADAGVNLILARPEGAAPGTRGLGLFLMPRFLDDGSPNHYRMMRLKDKLGTRSMASAEVKMEGAIAYPVGELDQGFKQMMECVNWSRLSNGVKSTALMRRAVHDAFAVLKGRIVFGEPLTVRPLARRQMMKIQLPVEQATSFTFFTADQLDKAEGRTGLPESQEAAAVLRLATPLLKFRATRDGRKVTGDALEMRGGCGYIEEWINPRLLRDAHLGSIWEGAGNIVALDALTRAIGKHRCHNAFWAEMKSRLAEMPDVPASHIERLGQYLDRAVEFADLVAASAADEAKCRQATSGLYHVATAILLAWEAQRTHEQRGDGRRLLWSRLTVDHRLAPRDPFADDNCEFEDKAAALLFADEPAPIQAVGDLMDLD